MVVTTRAVKKTIDPPMSSISKGGMRKKDDVAKTSGELGEATNKEVELSQKVVPIPRPPPLFPQRLVKKMEDGKHRQFITMLKQLSINVLLIEALVKMLGYANFMKDMVTKKSSVSFEDDERMQHYSVMLQYILGR